MAAQAIMRLTTLPTNGHGRRLIAVVFMIMRRSTGMHQPQHMGALRQIQSHALIARAMHTAVEQNDWLVQAFNAQPPPSEAIGVQMDGPNR